MKRFALYILMLFVLVPFCTFAASIDINGRGGIPAQGTKSISVSLDTAGTKINAIEGDILVFGDADIVDIRDGASFVSLWTETLSFEGNSAHFSGIIPGGFTGKGEVLSLVLRGMEEGEVTVSLSNVSLFLDDGMGTEEEIETERAVLPVSFDIQSETDADTIPPAPFSVGLINVATDPTVPVYALVFATDDKQTGIDRYEVQEVARGDEISEENWQRAESPYVIQDQTRTSEYVVRAYDNAGNVREEVYKPERSRGMIGGVLALVALLALVVWILRNYVRRSKRTR